MNKHKTTIHARCPYLPVWDYYEATFKTQEFIQCEVIEKHCDSVRGLEITQESLVDKLRELLPEHVSIKVIGRHGANCLTEITR